MKIRHDGPLLLVTFLDSFSPRFDQWHDMEFTEDFVESEIDCEIVGWLVHEDREAITLCSIRLPSGRGVEEREQLGRLFKIPKGALVSRVQLRAGGKG